MCTVCGCGETTVAARKEEGGGGHPHPRHDHHDHRHGADPGLDFGANGAGVSVGGVPERRLIEVETDILARNDAYAARNRVRLADLGAFAINLVSSPGSGKTTLLCRTIEALGPEGLAVIEGDQQTANDAERVRATGARAVQINTGKGCHLDAHMVGHAMTRLGVAAASTLLIENVGNLVCPAAFDLGEDATVAVLSVTEGEDKPLKYPDIFAGAQLAIVNKTDLAPYCDVDLERFEVNLRRVNPGIAVMRLSTRTGEGMGPWLAWLEAVRAAKVARCGASPQAHQASAAVGTEA